MLKPSVKRPHAPIATAVESIWIGSATYGIGKEVQDPTGVISSVLTLMNGQRSIEEVISKARSAHPDVSEASLRTIVDYFVNSGHIEDIGASTSLSADEEERYSRSREFFAWLDTKPRSSPWLIQELLKKAKVAVLGIGGVGSAVAVMLAASGIGEISIVDSDQIELSNLNRQILYSEADVGKSKVATAQQRLQDLNPHAMINAVEMRLSGTSDILKVVSGCDLFFRCADEPDDMPFWAAEASIESGIPWVNCSYNGPVVNVGAFVPGVTGCYMCMRLSERARLGSAGQMHLYTDAKAEFNAVIAPSAYLAGSWAGYEGIRILADMSPQTIGRMFHQNLVRYEHNYYINFEKWPMCVICGTGTDDVRHG